VSTDLKDSSIGWLFMRREGPSVKDSFTKAEGEDSLSPQEESKDYGLSPLLEILL